MNRIKPWLARAALFTLSVCLTLLLVEGILRFFPVAEIAFRLPLSPENPVIKFESSKKVTYSLGWNFYQISHKSTNNDGYYNDLDYFPYHQKPIIAVIGDSYVEAMQVDNSETFFAYLQKKYPRFLFYSFGASGLPLSSYLFLAEYAREKYHPLGYIFVIIGNDFDESFYFLRPHPGMAYFSENGSLFIVPYQPKPWKRLLAHSALVRYLFFNLNIRTLPYKVGFKKEKDKISEKKRVFWGLKATDFFLRSLPFYTGVDPSHILLLVDADRRAIYTRGKERNKYFQKMRTHLISQAHKFGFRVIDLHLTFKKDFQQHGLRFEFPTDFHWNERGHLKAAEAIIKSRFIDTLK